MTTSSIRHRSATTVRPAALGARLLGVALILGLCPLLHAQTSAVVHQFNFRVAEELTKEYSKNDRSRTVLPGFSVGTALTEAMVDSIAVDAERAFTRKLGFPVHMCWTKGKRGIGAGTFDMGGMLEGLPRNTFKLAKEYCTGETRFIELNCSITGGGAVTIGDKTKVKPMVVMTYQVFDPEKNEVMEKKVKLKDFAKLRSSTTYQGPVETRTAETLTAYDIYGMYRQALAELMSE